MTALAATQTATPAETVAFLALLVLALVVGIVLRRWDR